MHFRICFNLNVYLPRPDHSLRVSYRGISPIDVHVVQASRDGESISEGGEPIVVASTKRRDRAWLTDAFDDLMAKRFPAGSNVPELIASIHDGPQAEGAWRCEIDWLPLRLQQLLSEVSKDLGLAARSTVQIARWRAGERRHPNPIMSSRGLEWSVDGSDWRGAPLGLRARFEMSPKLRISDGLEAEVQRLVDSSLTAEPLGHQLLKESQDLSEKNPSTSLVIAIASLEAGLKRLISHAVPNAAWLVENTASPPVEKILTEYIPMLFSDFIPESENRLFPAELVANIRDGVASRNRIVHGTASSISEDLLDPVLHSIEDLLWVFDFLCGHDWAIRYASPDTQRWLGKTNNDG